MPFPQKAFARDDGEAHAGSDQRFIVDLAEMTEEQLLDLFLKMPIKVRDEQFIDTARAAELAGVTQRTIVTWIECGLVRAVRVGRRYQLSLPTLVRYLKSQAVKTRH